MTVKVRAADDRVLMDYGGIGPTTSLAKHLQKLTKCLLVPFDN